MKQTTLCMIVLCSATRFASPADPRAPAAAGHTLYGQGKYAEAAHAYVQTLKHAGRADAWRIVERVDTICRRQICKADALFAAHKSADAFAEYRKVLTMPWAEPHDKAAARLGMGRCLEAEKKWPQARAQYGMALANKGALWPDRGHAQLGIARCYEGEGNAPAARHAYERVLAMQNASRFDVAEAKRRLR